MHRPTACQNGVIRAFLHVIYLARYLAPALPIASTAFVIEKFFATNEPTFRSDVSPKVAILSSASSEESGSAKLPTMQLCKNAVAFTYDLSLFVVLDLELNDIQLTNFQMSIQFKYILKSRILIVSQKAGESLLFVLKHRATRVNASLFSFFQNGGLFVRACLYYCSNSIDSGVHSNIMFSFQTQEIKKSLRFGGG